MSHPQKKTKLSLPRHNQNQTRNADTMAGPSNAESSPEIFKLNIDCFDEIFEYLNVKDLYSIGQTCKRMNKVAGEYFKENHSLGRMLCEKDGIYTICWQNNHKNRPNDKRFLISGFNKFMPCIANNGYGIIKYIESHGSEFESTKHISLNGLRMNNERTKHFIRLLPQLEIVQHRDCWLTDNLHKLMAEHCQNLKEIYVQDSDASTCDWLSQEYPKLERLELMPRNSWAFNELREFFVRNPKVQRFSTNLICLWDNGDIFLNSNAKLDVLEVKGFYSPYCSNRQRTSKTPLELLNRLHEQGFYKRLYIYIDKADKELGTSFLSLKGLELLCISWLFESYNLWLPQLINLRELIIMNAMYARDMEIFANGLTKLERLYIVQASIDHIMPFIRRSPNLNKIKFIPGSRGVVLNLAMLNAERAMLIGARKITIYTRDDVFLATKWTSRNGETNLSLIEMRRADSIEWNPQYFPK
ncbi:uncharacterized protein LOC116348820 [Contarinia nasturtii]|uniref:uncharacterized protein LOC116348820 n=1 Tax=Contarinia nasturtii TaxID=265458 RepID=UPI0012D45BC2|nr:uncharacterized protein LOC116348820 [Contarinia nasturtii]XP_031635827.1 uncharacterized protein LOC116348820 [Contarinia nasturtii]